MAIGHPLTVHRILQRVSPTLNSPSSHTSLASDSTVRTPVRQQQYWPRGSLVSLKMASHLPRDRNSTPETTGSSLRLPSSRALPGHPLRASADVAGYSASRGVNPIRPASEVIGGSQGQNHGNDDGLDKAAQQWIADIDQYEATLEEMAAATLDQDFKDELSAIEQWFRVLSEAERTAALYALLQQTTQVQIRFFIQVLQQMAQSHPVTGMLSPASFGEKGQFRPTIVDSDRRADFDLQIPCLRD